MPKTPNTHLRDLLTQAAWSGAQLAAALRHTAAEHGQQLACDRSQVSRCLSGPRPAMVALLLEVLSRKVQRPISAVEAGLSRAPFMMVDLLVSEGDPVRRLSQLASADLDPGRRRLLGAGVYSLAALAAWPPRGNPLTGPSAGLPHAPGRSGRAGLAEAEQMRTMARVFAEAAQLHGPVHVRTALTAYLGRDVTGYLNAPAVEAERRQLLSGAAELTILLGTMCAGDGADALAQHYHGTAASLAAEAGDAATYAIALRTMSAHAHDLGHHSAAVLHLAQRAADVAPPIVAAYTQAHLAVIQAHHSKRAALAALAAAERHHGQAHDTIPGPFTHYPASALHYQRARTLATLRDRGGATSALTTSLRLRAPGERQATALTQARLAETLLAGGHLDAALTHWQAFLKDYPTLHSSHAERLLQSMRRLLNPHRRHPATNTLLTEAATLH